MDNGTFGEGSWIFGLIVLLGLFGGFGGGFGNNAGAFATMADVNAAINNQSTQQGLTAVQLSSANNNYETARLISDQNMSMMSQNNTNLINAIQGFNQVNQNIISQGNNISQAINNLGSHMDECCCSIKTMLLENRLQDTQIALQNAQNVAVNQGQTTYLLSQLGQWTPYSAPAAAARAA